jgi:dihydroxyacetone kinase
VQKLLNSPSAFVDEVLEGMVSASRGRVRLAEGDRRALIRADRDFSGRVTIATGGGSGHLPLFAGYVLQGLADGCAVGNLFASPSTDQMLSVTRAISGGHGVLYLYGNYQGDKLNFDAAAEQAQAEGIPVESVRAADDVSSAPPERAKRRRGVAGIWFGYVVAAAHAHRGDDLETVASAVRHTFDRTRSMGVALAPCILPTVGRPNFEIEPGQMEIGMGIHGEPGVRSGKLESADDITDQLLDAILADLSPATGADLAVLINGLGATPLEELYLVYRRTHQVLEARGHQVRFANVGEYATSQEMAGASISVMALDDDLTACLAWAEGG